MNKYYQLLGKSLSMARHRSGKGQEPLSAQRVALAGTGRPARHLRGAQHRPTETQRRTAALYERRAAGREVSRGGHQLVGLLWANARQQLSHLFEKLPPLIEKSTERSAAVRTMCSSSVPPTRRPTKHRASASYSSSSTAAIW